MEGPVCPRRASASCVLSSLPLSPSEQPKLVPRYLIRRRRGGLQKVSSAGPPGWCFFPMSFSLQFGVWGRAPRPAVPGPSAAVCLERVCGVETLKTETSRENTPQRLPALLLGPLGRVRRPCTLAAVFAGFSRPGDRSRSGRCSLGDGPGRPCGVGRAVSVVIGAGGQDDRLVCPPSAPRLWAHVWALLSAALRAEP